MVVVFIALAIPLGLSLRQIAWEANVSRSANGYIKDQFGKRASVSQIEIDFDADPILVNATVFTPKIFAGAAEQSSRVLSRTLGQPISVNVEQFKVETGEDANSAELAAAKMREQAQQAEIQVTQLRENLALIAGVSVDDVTLDTSKRRAMVTAKPLPGASLASYYALEQRVAAGAKGWIIKLQPPAIALPDLKITDGAVDPASRNNLDLIIWASERIGLPLGMSGTAANRAVATEALKAKNATIAQESDGAISGADVRFRWLAPLESTRLQQ